MHGRCMQASTCLLTCLPADCWDVECVNVLEVLTLPGSPVGSGVPCTCQAHSRAWQVREGASYPVRLATAHPIHENCRVRHFRRLLTAAPDTDAGEQLSLLGELMFQARMCRQAAAAARLE